MKAHPLLEKLVTTYGLKPDFRGQVFARFRFDEAGVHLEHWAVELPQAEEGVGVRRFGGAK